MDLITWIERAISAGPEARAKLAELAKKFPDFAGVFDTISALSLTADPANVLATAKEVGVALKDFLGSGVSEIDDNPINEV